MLLRISLPVLLFFYLARPVLSPTGLEQWLGTGGRSSQVVLIDDSVSMGYAAGEAPAFQRAQQAATALLASVRPQDHCTVVATSAPRAPVVHDVEGGRRDELAAAVASVPLVGHPRRLARGAGGGRRGLAILHLSHPAAHDRDRLAQERVGPRRPDDQPALERRGRPRADRRRRLRTKPPTSRSRRLCRSIARSWRVLPAPGKPTIKNDSPRTLAGAKAILRVDDKPTEVTLPEIAPHQTARVPLTVPFPGSGPHEFSLQIPDDELPGDNQRWVAVPVKDSLLIRLVDGEPSAEPFGSEVDYLAAPLSIGIGAAEAWRVEVVQEQDFLSQRLEPADVLVLANVAAPTAGAGRAPGTPGPGRDGPHDLHRRQARRRTLQRPAPSHRQPALADAAEEPWSTRTSAGSFVEPLRPSPLEKLLDLKPSALERVAVRQIMTVDEKGVENRGDQNQVRVLARWNDPSRSPAVAERVVGDGRVLLWTTTADRAGNDWPIEPSFVLAVREAVRGTARPTPLRQYDHGRRADAARCLLEPADHDCPLEPAWRRRAAVARGRAPRRDAGRSRPRRSTIAVPDTRRRGGVPRRLG